MPPDGMAIALENLPLPIVHLAGQPAEGKHTEARDLLSPVYGWFTEGFDTPVLQDAKALIDELALS